MRSHPQSLGMNRKKRTVIETAPLDENIFDSFAAYVEQADDEAVLANLSATHRKRLLSPVSLSDEQVRFEWTPGRGLTLYHGDADCRVGRAIPHVVTTRLRAVSLGGRACPKCYPHHPDTEQTTVTDHEQGVVITSGDG